MLDLTCGCFSSFSTAQIEVKILSSLLFSNIQQHNQIQTQGSNHQNENQGRGSGITDSAGNQASIITQQNAHSNCSTTSTSLINLHNQLVSNYSLIFSIKMVNSTIQPLYDFLYIVPDKAPLSPSFSYVNSRYKYKIFYVRRDKQDKLEALCTSDRFKLILRMKTQNTLLSPRQNQKNTINNVQNENINLPNGCQNSPSLEIFQAFEGDPDFYRENFDYEMKLLSYTPQNKQKLNTNGFDTSPVTAPFQIINNSNEAITKSHNQQMLNKNVKNFSALNSNYETSCNSLHQTNLLDNQATQQILKANCLQNYSNFESISCQNSQMNVNSNITQSNGFNIHSNNNTNNNSHNNSHLNSHINFNNSNMRNQSGHNFYNNYAKIDETFIIDDTKCNDYAMKMSNLLKQKIEQEVNHQQLQNNLNELQSKNINCSKELNLTNKQNKMKQKGKTLSNYNSEEFIQKRLKQKQTLNNKMLIQSAPKQNIINKTAQNSFTSTLASNKILSRNQAFIYNSECSNNVITPQSLSKKNSDYHFQQSENNPLTSSGQINQKTLHRTFKDDLSQSQINNTKFIMQTPCKNSSINQTTTNKRPPASAGLKSVQNSGTVPKVLLDFQQGMNNNSNQGSISQLGKLLKTQQKQSFLSSNKTSVTNTPNSSEQKFQLRFENDIQRMMIEQKVKNTQAKIEQKLQSASASIQIQANNSISTNSNLPNKSSPSTQNQLDNNGENTPIEQKLFTVEEANSQFETSIHRFYTQKSSPSKYRVTQTEVRNFYKDDFKLKFNRIDECDEYNNTQYTNSDLKKIKYHLRQFKNDQEYSSSSSQYLKTYEYYQNSSFNPDYSKISLNKSSQNIKNQQLSRREKTIQYMIPVYEYKMEKLGFNFIYDSDNKSIIISQYKKDESSPEKPLQQSVFKIDERIKTDQLTNYFEDICANIKYQTID